MALRPSFRGVVSIVPFVIVVSLALAGKATAQETLPVDPTNPANPVKLIFVHHSTGQNWLADGNGDLGIALRNANYFVSDTNYGWGPADQDAGGGTIGDHTDIGNFYSWFAGSHRDTYMTSLFAESGQHSSYSRLASDPGGANRIVMFKSCFPNSALGGNLTDPVPAIGSNPLRNQGVGSAHTFANAKGIYLSLLDYFATHQDALFVLIASPPLRPAETNSGQAALARALSDWLVDGWLASYPYRNVAVFDFYSALTSDGGSNRTNSPNVNDLGWADGNHHRYRGGTVEHMKSVANDTLAYPTGDSHPSRAGNLKATGEFVPLLNVAYHCWQGTGGCLGTVPAAATSFWNLSPCRIFDTRNVDGPDSAPPALGAGETRTMTVGGRCGIPTSAKTLSVNVTVTGQDQAGELLLYRGDLSVAPTASTLTFAPGKTRANNGMVELARDGSGTFKVRSSSTGEVHLIVDVNGYFE